MTEKETIRGGSGGTVDPKKNNKNSASSNSNRSLNQFRYAASGMQGRRHSMEDAHICHVFPDMNGHALFCVLDGHGGTEASEFASEELTRILCDTEDWQSYAQKVTPYLRKGKPEPRNRTMNDLTKLLEKALIRAFAELDRELYLEHFYGDEPEPSSTAGSTAVVVLLTPFVLVCANVGDSRSVLACSSTASPTSVTATPLSEDHTPILTTEKQRIEMAGGKVQLGRVNGELAVSRAFGDFELKDIAGLLLDEYDPNDADDAEQLLERAQKQMVTAFPEIRVYSRDNSTDRFIILACDGVWDVASNEDCVEWVTALLELGQDDLGIVCEHILDRCLQQGSQDNMTIVIVLLEAGQKLIGKATTSAGKKRR